MEGLGTSRIEKIAYTEPGIHRITLKAFGKTIHGREFRLVVPDFTFNVAVKHKGEKSNERMMKGEAGNALEVEDSKRRAERLKEKKAKVAIEIAQAKMEQQAIAEAEEQQTLIIIGVSNIVIVIIALIVFLVLRRKS